MVIGEAPVVLDTRKKKLNRPKSTISTGCSSGRARARTCCQSSGHGWNDRLCGGNSVILVIKPAKPGCA